MTVHRFADEFELVAPLYGRSLTELRANDAGNDRFLGRWFALVEDQVVATATAWTRPDERMFLSFVGDGAAWRGPLGAVAADDLGRAAHATVDAADTETRASLTEAGFSTAMASDVFMVSFDAALRWLRPRSVPVGFRLIGADVADRDHLFDLDNRLRDDVPGTDGWRGDRAWFDGELSESPPFDPSGYLVAVHEPSGEYAGLIRFWRNPAGPRLGLIGVLPAFRRTTIAAALLRAGLEAASTWGFDAFTTETSTSNRAIHPRLIRLGGHRVGRFIQMTFEPGRPAAE